ncbi:protein of unknown function [Paraburkholderia dioscoreae]|uniref:Uncharacterized protein n=1 Tax=Paraburkholderia dioscoreae TaxID=2604047 RepID=A0A5Q4ZLY3_9BURK|nr:protein of unknown function [Paraburkholderia dioscoreae]
MRTIARGLALRVRIALIIEATVRETRTVAFVFGPPPRSVFLSEYFHTEMNVTAPDTAPLRRRAEPSRMA